MSRHAPPKSGTEGSQVAEVVLEKSGGVARLTLNAPERRNAITPDMAREMIVACDQIDGDGDVGAVVVKGGAFFCAGAHRETLKEASVRPLAEGSYHDIETIYQAFTRVGALSVPTVAAVRGGAVGAGFNLALATDVRIVGEDARLLSGFLQLGIHPGGGHFSMLGRSGGREAAGGIGLFGQAISGERARELGIAWEAVPDAEVERVADELCAGVAVDPTLARYAVKVMRDELGPPAVPWNVALEMERGVQLWSFARKGRYPEATS